MGKDPSEIVREMSEQEIQDEEEVEKQVHLEQRIFKEETGEVNLGRRRCTDVKTSRRIGFPTGRNPKEEAELEIRKQKWLEVADRYIKEECKEDGTQKLETQMNKDQIAGKTKLEKR